MQSSNSPDPSRFVRRETELHSEIQAMKLESSPVTKDLTLGRREIQMAALKFRNKLLSFYRRKTRCHFEMAP